MYISLALASVLTWCVVPSSAQFPPNGDVGAFAKMEAAAEQLEKNTTRQAEKEEGLMDRALHFAKNAEKRATIQAFIERGSTVMPDGEAVIEQNKDAGVQKIDPRTPKGFGNPFFRKIHVEENLDQRALISESEEKAAKKAKKFLNPSADTVGWMRIWHSGQMTDSSTVWGPEFVSLLYTSPNKIIRRTCMSCDEEFQEIFYRRYTPFPNRKFLNIIVQGPFSGETSLPNVCGVDFDLYSTYADAIAKTNKWQHCHTSDTKGLPGYSGPVGHSNGQETCGSGCQPDYAYYVEEGNWIPIVGAIEFHINGDRDGQIIERANTNNFNSILANSGNSIIRRICVDCVAPYDDVYYRRYTSPPDDLYAILYHSFDHNMVGNKMGTDFNLFSTFEDAVRDINPWEYCVTYDPLNKAGFPNRCGPDYESTRMDQWHLYNERGNNVAGTAVQRTLIVIQNDGTDQVKFKQEWMTESEEMMAFLYPDEYGPVDDVGVRQCQEPGSYGTDDPALDVADTYNGWYDVTRCGKCNDYCRWVPLETKKARSNCPDVSGRSLPDPFAGGLPTDIVDEYAGWYDVSNCGSCNYYCRWVTSYPGLPGGGNPVFRTSYGAFVWWDCAPAGTQYNTMTWMPEALGYYYWGFSFNHNKCDQQGPIRATEVTEGIDPHISTVGESVHFSCIMSGSVGGTEPGHFDEFDHQKCSSEGADTPVTQRAEKFLGCFGDKSNRALPYRVGDGISYELCESTCRAKGYHYFGLQWQRECWCGALSASDDTYRRYGQMDAAACNYCMGNYFGDWRNCVWQVQDQFDPKAEWKKHECSHIPIQDTRKQCYISCRDKNDDVTNMLVCAKLKRAGMEWLAKEITQWLDSPVCANKDCSTNVHPLGKDIGNGKGTF
uniref:WSC domain-containing protein n=2 Tax=Ditylum brightwellii TaxID=49249 RepID=A0A6V2LP54_9STRA